MNSYGHDHTKRRSDETHPTYTALPLPGVCEIRWNNPTNTNEPTNKPNMEPPFVFVQSISPFRLIIVVTLEVISYHEVYKYTYRRNRHQHRRNQLDSEHTMGYWLVNDSQYNSPDYRTMPIYRYSKAKMGATMSHTVMVHGIAGMNQVYIQWSDSWRMFDMILVNTRTLQFVHRSIIHATSEPAQRHG